MTNSVCEVDQNKRRHRRPGSRPGVFFFLLIATLLCSISSKAQEIRASLDTTSILIGEQVRYRISVETNSEDLVVFPEGQTFSPLEMIESYSVDTTQLQERLQLSREYALTQFDSGSYTIPQQRVQVNDQAFLTDSIKIEVVDVVVDTTKQKLYPIKPSVEVPSELTFPGWAWWLVAILVLGLLAYFVFRRKKKREEAVKKLPAYEQAIFELRRLDDSHLLEQREIKEYYSQLTAAVRRYLDEEIYEHAMESTTGELIAHIETEINAGKLRVDHGTVEKLREILQRADLAKFANSKPDLLTAREDRSRVESIIKDTKEGIPEPTEEELLLDQLYKEKREKKQRRKKIALGVLVAFLALGGLTTYMIATKGFSYVKDTYLGHPTKELLEGEWIRSEYGTPAVIITTPKVLIRGEVELPDEVQSMLVGNETFLYGSLLGDYYVGLTTIQFDRQTNFNLETAVDGVYAFLESQGARNILMKQEEFTTVNGAEGIKMFGSLEMDNPVNGRAQKNEYVILNFAEGGGFQQITIIYKEEDAYAEEITQRILNSVELKNAGN